VFDWQHIHYTIMPLVKSKHFVDYPGGSIKMVIMYNHLIRNIYKLN